MNGAPIVATWTERGEVIIGEFKKRFDAL